MLTDKQILDHWYAVGFDMAEACLARIESKAAGLPNIAWRRL
jgi:hypothetical protein